MAWLPNLESQVVDDTMTLSWKIGIITLAYFGVLLFLALLGLALHNSFYFLYGQGRWKVLPLLCFYLLALIYLGLRCQTMIMVLELESIVSIYLPAYIKLLLGYTQIWTTLELSIRVRQCYYALV